MSKLADTTGNDDCNIIERLWQFLDNPASGKWYLGNIIKNGLDDSTLGINIPAFPSITVGDLPTQTMFKWALEYMGITLTGTKLSGLDTFRNGTLVCTPTSATETTVDFTFNFAQVIFSGNYDVGVSGVSGCAIASAAAVLGDNVSLTAAATPDPQQQQLELASWYRDDDKYGLQASENGRNMVGAYYLHQDTIQKVSTADNNYSSQYRQALAQQKQTSDAVYTSTKYYQQQKTGASEATGDAPTIGGATQYAGGFEAHVKLQMATQYMASQQGVDIVAELEQGSDNEYAELINSMETFNCHVLHFQKENPGEVATSQVMGAIPNANPDICSGVKQEAVEGVPGMGIRIFDLETGEVIKRLPLRPIPREKISKALAANVDALAGSPGWFHIKGAFSDAGQGVSLKLNVTFSNQGSALQGTVNRVGVTIGDLHITLGNKSAFDKHPGLYDKVSEWIANSGSFQDTLKSKLNNALDSDAFKSKIQEALNGGLKKLGL